MKLTDFDFDLPVELIAQEPSKNRDESKLLILDRKTGAISHDYFYNLPKYLNKDDLMVFNDTKVMPVRLVGRKDTGGEVEVLLTSPLHPSPKLRGGNEGGVYEFLGKNIKSAKRLFFEHGLVGSIEDKKIYFNINNADLMGYMDKYGQVPLPPYVKADRLLGVRSLGKRYQTVYAKVPGSAAAPTAGFHFSEKLIKRLKEGGIKMEYITLHVGLGTFAPIKSENIEEHRIHREQFRIPADTRSQILDARSTNSKVIAVGTTTVRTLETWARDRKISGETDIYIYPGFEFKVVDAMVTNFHMPHSSLVLLVAAFAGRENILKAYNEAIKMGYRFGSFGDAMLIV